MRRQSPGSIGTLTEFRTEIGIATFTVDPPLAANAPRSRWLACAHRTSRQTRGTGAMNAAVNALRNRVHCVHPRRSLESNQPGTPPRDRPPGSRQEAAMDADRLSDPPTFGDLLRQHRLAAGLTPGRAGRAGGLEPARHQRPGAWRAHPSVPRDGAGSSPTRSGSMDQQRRGFLAAARDGATSAVGAETFAFAPPPRPAEPADRPRRRGRNGDRAPARSGRCGC